MLTDRYSCPHPAEFWFVLSGWVALVNEKEEQAALLSQRGLKVRLGERGLVIWGRMGSLRLEAMRPLGGEAGRCIFVNEEQEENHGVSPDAEVFCSSLWLWGLLWCFSIV